MGLPTVVLATADVLAKKHPKPPSFVPGPSSFDAGGGGISLGMTPVLFFAGALLLVVLVAYASYVSKQRRRAGFIQMANQLRLTYSAEDPFGLLGYPFTLFRKGDGQGVENVLHGVWQEVDVIAFDFWYYTESTDSKGATSRSYARFDCAIVAVEADCPRLAIERENVLTRLADHLSFHDIQFESEEFNRAFNVACDDEKFANDVIDARMMQWLLANGGDHAFEAIGNRVLVIAPRIDPVEFPQLLGLARGFVQHVPKVVNGLYPG